jgi:Molybdopterin-binding domain of aldehyde dehydrogenase
MQTEKSFAQQPSAAGRATSSGSTSTAKSGIVSTSCWMRASNLTIPTMPTLSPKLRKVPRRSFSMAMAFHEFPYLAHAPLEPINAAARMNADGTLEVWGGHQMPDVYQAVAAKVADIAPDKVILHVMKTGGGFGRRASVDSDIIIVTLDKGRIVEGNFNSYDALVIDEMPSVEVHIVNLRQLGLASLAFRRSDLRWPTRFKATGRRIRILPFANSENS